MAYAYDPEIAAVFAANAEELANAPVAARGDWKSMREYGNVGLAAMSALAPPTPDVRVKAYSTTAPDGAAIELRWYTRNDEAPGSAVVFAHGGGMVLGNLDVYDAVCARYVDTTGVPFLSVGYRLAPEATGTSLAEDTFAGLRWLLDHAAELGVDPGRVAIMGDSAGGGIAAGVAILARDRGVALARQILVYPMLDDRSLTPDPLLEPWLTWDYDGNFTGWSALLGDELGSETVSPVAAPARLTDFAGLAPAYLDVGELDLFRDEDLVYAQRLAQAGVPIELHVHPGAPHGFERIAPDTQVARRAIDDRTRVIGSL
jgi:acetyl esterase/lipase